MRFLRNMIVWMIAISLPIWVVGYTIATRSEAYRVAGRILRQSEVVRSQVGKPESVRLAFFDGFSYSSVGTDASASFRFHVRGAEQGAVVDLRLQRKVGEWKLTEGNLIDKEGTLHTLHPTTVSAPALP